MYVCMYVYMCGYIYIYKTSNSRNNNYVFKNKYTFLENQWSIILHTRTQLKNVYHKAPDRLI